MRFLLYNIRYGTGGKNSTLPWRGFFRKTANNLDNIIQFIRPLEPDIIGLLEVDAGSYRSGNSNQAETIADDLGHYHSYRSKYCKTTRFPHILPVMNQQGNAFIAKDTIRKEKFHYFDRGVKRLVIELELENVVIFLVHLALGFRVRQNQLSDLYSLVKDTKKPHIVAGDFNSLGGEKEIKLFMAATGLLNANEDGGPTFPSWKPKRHLDFVLYSDEIEMRKFWMPNVTYSDHLPLIFDFHINGAKPNAAPIDQSLQENHA